MEPINMTREEAEKVLSEAGVRINPEEFLAVLDATRQDLGEDDLAKLARDPLIKGMIDSHQAMGEIISENWLFTNYCLTAIDGEAGKTSMFKHLTDHEEYVRGIINSGVQAVIKPLLMGRKSEIQCPFYKPSNPFASKTHHIIKTMLISLALASELGVTDQQEIEAIGIGAGLHDIGQYLPRLRQIAENPTTQLSSEDIRTMMTHPVLGGVFVAASGYELPELSKLMILYHHKDLKGGGYPDISASNLPLGVRIIQVADRYEAGVGDRPYKRRPEPPAEVLTDLIDQAEKGLLDIDVVNALTMLARSDKSNPRITGHYRKTTGEPKHQNLYERMRVQNLGPAVIREAPKQYM